MRTSRSTVSSLGALAMVALVTLVFSSCSDTDAPAPAATPPRDALGAILERGTLIVACDASYPPFETIDPDTGQIIGFDVEMVTEIAGRWNLKVRFDNTDWDGIITALLTGKCDIICSGMSITEERKQRIAFTAPYDHVGQVAMIRADRAADFPDIASFDAPGIKVGVQVGTTGEQAARKHMPRAQVLTFTTAGEAASDVLAGQSDVLVFDDPFVRDFMKTSPGKLALVGEAFTTEPIGIALRKGEDALLEKLQSTLDAMEADGYLEKLRERWRK